VCTDARNDQDARGISFSEFELPGAPASQACGRRQTKIVLPIDHAR
jgi:hypothetical protein